MIVILPKTGSPIMNAIKPENTQPYIIAYGPDPKTMQQYFIIVEQKPMNVSGKYNTLSAISIMNLE